MIIALTGLFAAVVLVNERILADRTYEFAEKEITNTGLSLKSWNNENVVFDGTRSIDDLKDITVNGGNWEEWSTDIVTDANQTINDKTLYRIKLRDDVEIWQLFNMPRIRWKIFAKGNVDL